MMTIRLIPCPVRLCTKDGRKIGNAFCYARSGDSYKVITDFGNKLTVTRRELEDFWHTITDEPTITFEQWSKARDELH